MAINHRSGLLISFLKLNGYVLPVSTDEQVAMLWRAASNEISEAEFAEWVERSIVPRDR